MPKKIVFATCNDAPEIQPSDALVADALSVSDVSVCAAPWNGLSAPFKGADLIVVRSTWDYPHQADAFTKWLYGLSDGAVVVNSPSLMVWNMTKVYLESLRKVGAPLPPTHFVRPEAKAIFNAVEALGVAEAVVKPVIGATASGLSVVRRGEMADFEAAAAKLGRDGLVQPLIKQIKTHGETSLIYIDGHFTHAVLKRPKQGDIRVQSDFGGTATAIDPPLWVIGEGERILKMLPEQPTYARVDVVILDETLQLMEVEVIEPELFFTHAPKAADRFAAALLKKM